MPDYIDEYGGDLQDPKQRCRHGTFIGSWSGPDYMCGWCESGEEPEEDTTPRCQWSDSYPDFDGALAVSECDEPARHTVVTEDKWGENRNILCSYHTGCVWDHGAHVDDEGTVWMDAGRTERFRELLVGKVVQS